MAEEEKTDSVLTEELARIVQRAALDGTLTSSAAAQVKEALEKLHTTSVQLSHFKREFDRKSAEINGLTRELREVNDQLQKWCARDAELRDREAKITRLEMRAEAEAQRVQDHKEMFSAVFRNIETRRAVFSVVPGMPADQYSGYRREPTVERNEAEETQG